MARVVKDTDLARAYAEAAKAAADMAVACTALASAYAELAELHTP
jgi:hypothetical protein